MYNKMFNHTNLMAKALDASWTRNQVISQNIANVDTPDYNRKTVSFEDEFRDALQADDGFQHRRTREKHVVPERIDPSDVGISVLTDTVTTMRMDGNNVDIDKEMVDLAENVIMYNTLVTKTAKELSRLRTAITGPT
ncbi:flagellar basal body rod protein FlgB [Oscillospiraceae bacterium OttesenSCG-928-F05]|nr:flagellar basal body rod protein FlgB [Oscillospiraceae bacterium OttesenSCG-928-F05]